MTPEGRVKAAVDALLKHWKSYKHKPVGNGMGEPALDYHVGHQGFYAAIETKANGGEPTVRQTRTMHNVVDAGNSLFLIESTTGLDIQELANWLKYPVRSYVSCSAQKWLNDHPRKVNEPCNVGSRNP